MEQFEIRNATYTENNVAIDVEWNHPQFGWIPFTATPDDPMPYGKEIHDQALAAGDVAPYVPPPPEALAEPELTPMEQKILELEARLKALETG